MGSATLAALAFALALAAAAPVLTTAAEPTMRVALEPTPAAGDSGARVPVASRADRRLPGPASRAGQAAAPAAAPPPGNDVAAGSQPLLSTLGALALGVIGLLWVRRHTRQL